jgi:hypothetical protein
MQSNVIAIVVRKAAGGWDWTLWDEGGVSLAQGQAPTQEAAMSDGWRRARLMCPSHPPPELIIDPSSRRAAA